MHRERPMAMKLLRSQEEEQQHDQGGEQDQQQQQPVYDCYCGRGEDKQDNIVVRCDECHLCSHGSCVGANRELLMDEWLCDACRLGRIAKRERAKFGHREDVAVLMDQLYVMRQSFMATLSHRTGVSGLEPAIAYHMARWADELENTHANSATATTRVVVNNILEYWERGVAATRVGETLTEEGGIRVVLALLANTTQLMNSFRLHLGFLVDALLE